MKKRIITIYFILLILNILFIKQYNAFAVTWGSISAGSDGTFQTCGTTYNGCIGVDSYRYTIVKNIRINDDDFSYTKVSGTRSYEKKARNENSWNYKDLHSGIISDIKTGGDLFEEIIENTNVDMQKFFSEKYYIMIEVKHIIYYSDSGSSGSFKNNKTLIGYTKEIANALLSDIRSDTSGTFIYINNKKATGLRRSIQNLPCYAYIPKSGTSYDNYCTQEASELKIRKYLRIAKDNNRFGKVLVYADDITKPKGGIKIVKTDSKTGSKIKDVEFKLYSGNTCSGDALKTKKTNNSGATTFSNLNPGSYSVYESKIPSGYVTPSNRCTSVTVTAGSTTTKKITNTPKGNIKIEKTNSATGSKIKNVEFKLYRGNICSGDALKTQKTNNSGEITFSNLNPGSYSVYESTIPSGYVTPSNRCTPVTVTAGSTTTKTITNTQKGGFIIRKAKIDGTLLTSLDNIKFSIYDNSECLGTPIKTNIIPCNNSNKDKCTSTILDPGEYYLKEYETKTGYRLPEKGDEWYCKKITITAGAQKQEITVKNSTICEYEFENLENKNDMKLRIDLYNKMKDDYRQELNGLLNLDNLEATTACSKIRVEKNYDNSCLSASTSTNYLDFSVNNVSKYTEKYGNYTFCLTTFKLENKLEKSDFGTIKSGQPIIKTDSIIATGTLNRVCYNYGDDLNIITIPELSYSEYIKEEPKLDEQELIGIQNFSVADILNQTITKNYTLSQIVIHNKDGRKYYACPIENQCKDLGHGILSNFNETPGVKSLEFTIKLNEGIFGNLNSSTHCNYTIENELIDNKNNINLEFRSVKTGITNSFFSKTGSTRRIGINWSDEDVRKQVLKDNNDSYNKNNGSPKYSITLTPSIVEDIRNYNKDKKYDDYTLKCRENGTLCVSEFLSNYKNEWSVLGSNSRNRYCYGYEDAYNCNL